MRSANTSRTVDFAMTEAAYVVFRVLQAFSISLPPGGREGSDKHKVALVMSIADGCVVQLQPR